MSEEFVGAGLAFPLRTDRTGSLALVRHHHEIEESIRLILGTAPGDRPMRPEFGCGIHEHVFAPVNDTTAGILMHEVRQALLRWEPRVAVEDVEILFDADDPSLLYIDITYRIRDENDPRNLVFPFYTIPSEE